MNLPCGDQPISDVRHVEFDAYLAQTLLGYLRGAWQHERGGVLLGQRGGGRVAVSGAVFPPQLAHASDHCAFDVQQIDVIRQALTAVADNDFIRIAGTIVGWAHSHPGHGLFLSRTDVETFKAWAQLDDQAVAVVADPFLRRLPAQQIAWWYRERKGRMVGWEHSSAGAMTLRHASSVAQAISDITSDSRNWDVVAPSCIIRLFPARHSGDPEPPPAAIGPQDADQERGALW